MEQFIAVADTVHVVHHAIGWDGIIEYVRHHAVPLLRSRRRAAR